MAFNKELINDTNYNKKIMKLETPFILVFSTKTCPHCRVVEKFLEKIQNDFESIEIFIIESEKSPKLLEKFGVRAFPTTFFFNKEKMSEGRIVGEGTIEEFFDNFNLLVGRKKKGFLQRIFGGKNEKN